ncbi:hypothetical protein ABQJ54_07680 [Rhodanobacter sp. Si-c]|uniref:Aspartate ammonia-lyase n=1 Tax=Rhodanobacter lycopersici TaxID=3162487 RepID=A0ABV3QD41_9GAMM
MTMNAFQVAVAAEAYVAALFAQVGCDVSIQYGANQPEYDLIATKGNIFKKISVKGSKDGGWVLAAGLKKGRDYHEAIDAWFNRHKDKSVVYAFVQFKDAPVGSMPRVYLCEVVEVANHLKSSRNKYGYTSLREHYVWASGIAKDSIDAIPDDWRFTEERIMQLWNRK